MVERNLVTVDMRVRFSSSTPSYGLKVLRQHVSLSARERGLDSRWGRHIGVW